MLSTTGKTVLLLILTYLIWSTGFISIKYCAEYLEPIQLMFFRMLPPLLIFGLAWKKLKPAKIYPEDIKWIVAMAFFDPLAVIFIQSYGSRLTTASQAGMIFACTPLFLALAAWIFFKEKIRKRAVIGIAIAMCGVMLVAFMGKASAQAPNPLLGNFLIFITVCCAMGYALIAKKLGGRYTPYFLLCVQSILANIVQIPIFLFHLPKPGTPVSTYFIMLYVGLFSVCFGYIIYNRALATIKVAYVSLLQTLFPIFVLFLGHIIFQERLSVLQYLGSATVILGALIAGMPEKSLEHKTSI